MADLLFASAGIALLISLVMTAGQLTGVARWTSVIAGVSAGTMGVGNGIEHCAVDAFFVAYVFGAMAMVVSTVALGLWVLLFGGGIRCLGPLLIAGVIAFAVANDNIGPIIFGLVWVIAGLTVGGFTTHPRRATGGT